MTQPMNYIDLFTVTEQLRQAMLMVEELQGVAYDDDGKNSPANRVLRDRLLFLADTLALSSNLVKGEYWHGRVRR